MILWADQLLRMAATGWRSSVLQWPVSCWRACASGHHLSQYSGSPLYLLSLPAKWLLCLFVDSEKMFWSWAISSSGTDFAADANLIATSTSECGSWEAVLVAAGSGLSFAVQSVDRCFDFLRVSSADLMDPLRQTPSWHLRTGLGFFHPGSSCIWKFLQLQCSPSFGDLDEDLSENGCYSAIFSSGLTSCLRGRCWHLWDFWEFSFFHLALFAVVAFEAPFGTRRCYSYSVCKMLSPLVLRMTSTERRNHWLAEFGYWLFLDFCSSFAWQCQNRMIGLLLDASSNQSNSE